MTTCNFRKWASACDSRWLPGGGRQEAEEYKDILGRVCYPDGDGVSRVCDIKAHQTVQLNRP